MRRPGWRIHQRMSANALTPEMFTHDTTRRVFEAMVAQYRANGPVDGVTLVVASAG
ncbi:DnaB-like helicase N-terminal domain-containing protein [Anaeromassilibacillus sp. SJQ-1]|uniref:DnaB-like helicase N-terminal domain-containing protein n=1 Tax=Anaeromassilibacillus sp. SJQ-1 TaxID=3375419 RepID=UPI003989C754